MVDAIASVTMTNAMSVDIEEYFQVGAFEKTIDRSRWDRVNSRVEYNTQIVLDLFAEHNVQATFFTLGWVAERYPHLIRSIVAQGHELASHGYDHTRVHMLDATTFAADLIRTKALLQDAGGVAVQGYRAPSFSIGERNLWALDVLAEQGYAYSSSVYPIAHDHYGWPSASRFAFRPVDNSPMIEAPVTTVQAMGRTFPCGGGGYFRLLPYEVSRWAMRRVNGQDQQPCIFYFHPWEVDPEQPRIAAAPRLSRFRHYTNLDVMRTKLSRVLSDFRWDRMDRVFLGNTPLAAAA